MAEAAKDSPIIRTANEARFQSILRFAAGTTGAFVLCEVMGWYPTFLAPLLAGVLLANLPGPPPFKLGLVLVLVQAVGAYAAYILTSLMHEVPFVLFGAIAVILIFCFANLARGRAFLPILLVLISFSTIPIVTMIAPGQAGALPFAYTRGMAVAVAAIWLAYAVWPRISQSASGSQAGLDFPIARALIGVTIVLPLMLVYLMYGITDALPVLITTVMLVINFDPKRGAMQGIAMMLGVFIGGLIALLAYAALQIAASLTALALLTLLIALFFADRIERGGAAKAVGLITFNQALVLFSLSLAQGSSPGLWATRLVQFGMACIFAVGMMSLLFPWLQRHTRRLQLQ